MLSMRRVTAKPPKMLMDASSTATKDSTVTAVCAYNDETAMAVLAGMQRRGLRAPDDIAVIGVGDIAAAQASLPPLSTIGFDYEETGRELAQAILESLAGGKPVPQDGLSRPRLVRRASA